MKKSTMLIVIIISFLCLFIIIHFNKEYKLKNAHEYWLVCTNDAYDGYTETIKYRYLDNKLYGFYRVEEFSPKNEEIRKKTLIMFNENLKKIKLGDEFDYKKKEKDGKITITTYIGVYHIPDIFESYMSNQNIKRDFKIDQLNYYYKELGYDCEGIKK